MSADHYDGLIAAAGRTHRTTEMPDVVLNAIERAAMDPKCRLGRHPILHTSAHYRAMRSRLRLLLWYGNSALTVFAVPNFRSSTDAKEGYKCVS